ncbi:hypothetical protein GCM10010472_45480 [Pseudonocardia halophobica]|uniref:Short subunit dehydrogenase n=1 Tax=Pseudonocardia halophobica TaxID=29401 RepID=A0A9W6L601_9PSEU|nr:hypothetical protein GCM10017577_50280 [Pseudonocardia halophobica]
MDLGIEGKRAAVAAGTAGLGYASAAALVAEGARVTLCGSDAGRAEAAARALGGGTEWLVADLSGPEGAEEFVRRAGEPDILVVNGPGPAPGTALSASLADYRAGVDRSLLAVIAMCQAAVPGMRAQGWGRIVAITSLAVRQPYPNLAPSNAARPGPPASCARWPARSRRTASRSTPSCPACTRPRVCAASTAKVTPRRWTRL